MQLDKAIETFILFNEKFFKLLKSLDQTIGG